MTVQIKRHKFTRFWAVYVDGTLLCVAAYKKGANAVKDFINKTSSMCEY